MTAPTLDVFDDADFVDDLTPKPLNLEPEPTSEPDMEFAGFVVANADRPIVYPEGFVVPPSPDQDDTPGVPRRESIILRGLFHDLDYSKHLQHLTADLFHDKAERIVFEAVGDYVTRYRVDPSQSAISLGISHAKHISQEEYDAALACLNDVVGCGKLTEPAKWIEDTTEQFIKDKSLHSGLLDLSVALTDRNEGKTPKQSVDDCIARITKANAFTLSPPSLGLTLDWRPLYGHLQTHDEKFPFDLATLNIMAGGGLCRKRIGTIMAPTGLGKSLILCHLCCGYLRAGLNVLYITLENSDVETLARFRANLLDIELDALEKMTESEWEAADTDLNRFGSLGDLRIRYYPPLSVHTGHFRQYLGELKVSGFEPDVIVVDYVGECLSQTMPYSKTNGAYQVLGAVVSELKAVANDYDALVLTAQQTNREGYEGEASLNKTGDSVQINAKSDFVLGVYRDEKHTGPESLMFKVLKFRNQKHNTTPFSLGVETGRMKLIDNDPASSYSAKMVKARLTTPPAPKTRKSSAPAHLKV